MKRLELWHWRYFDPVRKRKVTTRFVLGEADAALQYPDGATQVMATLVEKPIPDARRIARLLGIGDAFLHVTHNPVGVESLDGDSKRAWPKRPARIAAKTSPEPPVAMPGLPVQLTKTCPEGEA